MGKGVGVGAEAEEKAEPFKGNGNFPRPQISIFKPELLRHSFPTLQKSLILPRQDGKAERYTIGWSVPGFLTEQ